MLSPLRHRPTAWAKVRQLAVAGAKLKAWHAVRAKERQLAALKKGAAPVPANLPERAEGDARAHAAKAVGVGHTLIDQAELPGRSLITGWLAPRPAATLCQACSCQQ